MVGRGEFILLHCKFELLELTSRETPRLQDRLRLVSIRRLTKEVLLVKLVGLFEDLEVLLFASVTVAAFHKSFV